MKKTKAIFLTLVLLLIAGIALWSPVSRATQYHIGQKVLVEWRGTWYDATVIGFGNGCTMIHYDGYSSSWDECVGSGRTRPR